MQKIYLKNFPKKYTPSQCGFYYYDQKGVIFGQYGSFSKKLAKMSYFHKSGFESSFEEEISLSNI